MDAQKPENWTEKGAPWIKFLVPLIFSLAGLLIWVFWGGWGGLFVFIGLFLIGSMIGSRLFKRWASEAQVKADLRARLKND